MAPHPDSGSWKRGTAALIIAVATVVALLVFPPAYRIFFAISLGIAVVVVFILYLWHKLRPIRPEDVEDKRPLKLK